MDTFLVPLPATTSGSVPENKQFYFLFIQDRVACNIHVMKIRQFRSRANFYSIEITYISFPFFVHNVSPLRNIHSKESCSAFRSSVSSPLKRLDFCFHGNIKLCIRIFLIFSHWHIHRIINNIPIHKITAQ